jgi:hypothetical protein
VPFINETRPDTGHISARMNSNTRPEGLRLWQSPSNFLNRRWNDPNFIGKQLAAGEFKKLKVATSTVLGGRLQGGETHMYRETSNGPGPSWAGRYDALASVV